MQFEISVANSVLFRTLLKFHAVNIRDLLEDELWWPK